MTEDKFYNIASWNKKKSALQRIEIILIMYAMILVCHWIHFEWWVHYDWACFIMSCGYFLLLFVGHKAHSISDIDRYQRLQDLADYSEAPYFANNAPIRSGDFMLLSNDDYLQLDYHTTFIGKDIDFNSLYQIEFILKDEGNIKYQIRGQGYGYGEVLDELYKEIKDDNLDIVSIYNKFGDLKWRKSNKLKIKSKVHLYNLRIYEAVYPILQFVVSVLPIAYMLYMNISAEKN